MPYTRSGIPYTAKPLSRPGIQNRRAYVKGVSDASRMRTRKGYSSVPRSRGAAVTGEMKVFDCEMGTGTNLTAVTTQWTAGTLVDPATTVNLGSAAVANPLCLFVPTVGAALNQRVGRNVHVHKIKVRGYVQCSPQSAQTLGDANAMIRYGIVMDKQTNASQMTTAQLFNNASAGPSTINSFQNPNNFGRFQVLADKRMTIQDLNLAGSPTSGDLVQQGFMRPFKISHTFKTPVKVQFNATNGGTVADIVDNSFHFFIGTNSVAYVPAVAYYSRVSYKE